MHGTLHVAKWQVRAGKSGHVPADLVSEVKGQSSTQLVCVYSGGTYMESGYIV